MKWEDLTTYDRSLSLLRSGDLKAYSPKYCARLATTMMGARRFEIQPNASKRIRDAITSYPELLAENSQFAIPPFEKTWIEFETKYLIQHDLMTRVMEPYADRRVGYLFQGNTVMIFSEDSKYEPSPGVLAYRLNSPMPMELQQQFAEWFGISRIGIDPFLWGHTMTQYLDESVKRSLRDQHTLMISPGMETFFGKDDPKTIPLMVRDSYHGSAGELRNILGILLMLNQPSRVRAIKDVPRKRGIVRGKPMPYFGHSTIDICLDKLDNASLLSRPREGEHASPRWHEVRGHFCHNAAARKATHAHAWAQVDDRRWECQAGCGGKRWWREFPEGRGSAQVGFVHQERRITTKEDISARGDRN